MKGAETIRQSLPVLVFLTMAGVLVGGLFSRLSISYSSLPGVIVIVPAIIGLRGNVGAAMGSRLGSAVHLGLVDTRNILDVETKTNIWSSIILSSTMATFAGIAGYVAIIASGGRTSLLKLVAVSFLAGTVSGVVLAFITVGIVMVAVRRGVDPDNVTTPTLSTVGDMITMVALFGSLALVGGV